MRKIILIVILFILAGIAIGYFYLYQDHRNISKESASFQLTAKALVSEFQNDPASANVKYLNKTIEVSGKAMEITDSTILLENGIFCGFNEKVDISLKDKDVTIKGRCIGFDELFGEVKLDQCSILK